MISLVRERRIETTRAISKLEQLKTFKKVALFRGAAFFFF